MSGKEATLPSSPPLRTAREGSPSSSSSLSNVLERTRLHFGVSLAVELLMAGGMQQHAAFELIASSFGSPDLVVVVPPCQFGDPLVTVRAQSLLPVPERHELPFSPLAAFHFD